MNIRLSKNTRIIVSLSALCLFFLSLIWVSYFRQRSFDKKDAIHFAVEKNSNLAVALEQYAISTLHNADAVLQLVRIEYAREGDTMNLQKILAKNLLTQDIIGGVSIINNKGKLVMANTPSPNTASISFADRSYFIFHSQNQVDSLFISKPLISRSIGKPVIIISRRFNNSKGQFGGVVTLQIEPSRFTAFYAQAKLLPNDLISLIAPDGSTYARRTGTRESSGEDIHQSPLFINVAQNIDSFYFAPDAIRHIPTWFSYRKLKDYPIIATVGSSESDILSDYKKRQGRIMIPRIIISILIVLFAFLITLILIHRLKSLNRLANEKERYERLLTEQMIAVQEREREWIGRELHDNVNQVLTTVKLYLEMASKQDSSPLIPKSMQLINSSITEIRNLSHQLSAPTLGTRSLIDSINALVEMINFSSNLNLVFDHSGYKIRVIMSQKLALYRILQEQLNNIIKHANASKVWIVLNQKGNNVILTVKDNGKGFNGNKSNGMGLNNITSRAKILGGTVHIDTAPGKGCLLRVSIPMVTVEQKSDVKENQAAVTAWSF